MKLFFFLLLLSLSACSVLSSPITLKDPSEAIITVTVSYPDSTEKLFHLPNFSPLSRLWGQLNCERCDLSQLNPKMVLKDGDRIVLKENAGFFVSINQATLEELMMLPGIGEGYAQRILEYRNTHGLFQTIEDIMKVKGIKERLFDKIKAYLSL